MASEHRRGGARPAARPTDKRRRAGAPRPYAAGSRPNVVTRLEEVARLLLKHSERFSEEELTAIGTQARSIAGLVEVEVARRWDAADASPE